MRRKQILAFILAAAMVLGDTVPSFAAELTDKLSIEQPETVEKEETGSEEEKTDPEIEGEQEKEKEPEIEGEEEQDPETGGEQEEEQEPSEDEETEDSEENPDEEDTDPAESEGDIEEDIEEDELVPDDIQMELVEVDASDYVLQAGGNGILPEEEEGIALFSTAEEEAEEIIAAALKERKESINIGSCGLTPAQLNKVYFNTLNKNPSLFYVKSAWSYNYNPSTGTVVYVFPVYLSQYNANSITKYEEAVEKALASVNEEMSDPEKALALHDYLVQYCAYENDGAQPYQNYNAYNALVDGEAVCQGYTLAYSDLLQRVGISVSYASSDAMNHIWNVVELDGEWYHVDNTWDDPVPDYAGLVRHNNFLCSDEGIWEQGHYSWYTGIDGLECTDDRYASGQFWNNVITAVHFQGSTCYYMSNAGKIMERKADGSEKEVYSLLNSKWPVWGQPYYFYQGVFAGLSRSDDYLYCNDINSVYRISLSSLKGDKIYTYTKGDGYLYGSYVCEDEIRLAVSQNPNNRPTRLTVPMPVEPVRLYRITDEGRELIDNYNTLGAAKEEMLSGGGNYRIELRGNIFLNEKEDLEFPDGVTCQVDLNGRTLTVPFLGEEVTINADLYGGSNGRGVIAVEGSQTLKLVSHESGELAISYASATGRLLLGEEEAEQSVTLEGVTVSGMPDVSVYSNVTADAASVFTVGELNVPEASENVTLEGKIAAKTFVYQAKDMTVSNLTVSGQAAMEGGSALVVKDSVSFSKVAVHNGIFTLKLLKVTDRNGETIRTGTAVFTGELTKDSGSEYAVRLERVKMVEGSEADPVSDILALEDVLVSVTAKEAVAPTEYFGIPEDPHGRNLCLVREGNDLKVKGVVVQVKRQGNEKVRGYISLDDAAVNLAKDFGDQKGSYQFTFLSDTALTKNLTLPACVEQLELQAGRLNGSRLFACVDLKGFTWSTTASVTLAEGLQIRSSDKKGTWNLADFQVEFLPAVDSIAWVDPQGQSITEPESWLLLKDVDMKATGKISLGGENIELSRKYTLHSDISAGELCVESGKWVLSNVTPSVYQISEGAEVSQANIVLSNASVVIDGNAFVDGSVTMSNTKLTVKENGRLDGDVVVKTAYGKEAAENAYTIENHGFMNGADLQMPKGTFVNQGTTRFRTVSSMNVLENNGFFVSGSFNQTTANRIRLKQNSVLAIMEKAVLYNAELGGGRLYQTEGCNMALEGKVSLLEELPEGVSGLECAVVSQMTVEAWLNGEERPSAEEAAVETIAPQTRLFTTKIAGFPTAYISVRQKDADSEYTKVYQIGQNIQVGKEWIVISARDMEENETKLRSFLRWSDAMTYLSNLSNPNMTYIVDILDDLNIEQGLTMPARSAGLMIRGNLMQQEGKDPRMNVLTYTGDLNLTTPLEFSQIELKARKNNADYESVVKLNGMRLTFSNGAKGTFASLNGSASSVLALDGGSGIEVHGAVSVGELWSDGNGTLTGLAAVKRSGGQITSVTPQITISGQTNIQNGKIQIYLQEKITVNKAASYSRLDFTADEATQIRTQGVRLAKIPYAKPQTFQGYYYSKTSTQGGASQTLHSFGSMGKKDGYLLWFDDTMKTGVKLVYGTDGDKTEIPFRTFADAVAEINSLKTKRDYTIQIQWAAAEISKESPAVLTMPNKKYVESLCIEMTGLAEGSMAELYYLGGLTFTGNTVLKNIAFKQMVKSGKVYVPAEELNGGYPSPMSLKTGGFDLTVEGKVTFNTPVNLEGGNSGAFVIRPGASLVTVTNEIGEENDSFNEGDNAAVSVIAGTVRKFKTFDVPTGQEIQISQYGTVNKNTIKYTAAELNVTGMNIRGSVVLKGGNAVVKDLVLNDGALMAMGENAGKATLTNVTLQGNTLSEIYADRAFTISGNLDNQTWNAEFYTRQKPVSKGAVQMPYLNITGKVTSADGHRITVCVYPNDCGDDTPALLSEAPKASGQLLTAKTAGVEYFAVDPLNLGEEAEEGKGGLYSPENPEGYMLAKAGSNIYVYDSGRVNVALCKGDVSDGDWENAQIVNYYSGWAEAVAALNALNQTKETYTLLLLKDAGTRETPLKLTLPGKAAKVYIAGVKDSADGGQKEMYYTNAPSLGTHTEFANVTLHPVTAKGIDTSLGISAGKFDLTLRNIRMGGEGSRSLKDISGKGSVTLAAKDLMIAGGISGVKNLTVQENARIAGAVKAEELILQGGNVSFTTEGAVTVTNIIVRDGNGILKFGRTNKDTSNLTVNGDIRSEGGGHLQLYMETPSGESLLRDESDYVLTQEFLKDNSGEKTVLSDTKKLAVMPKAATSDFEFLVDGHSVSDRVVKANKGLYLIDERENGLAKYTVELEVEEKDVRVRCLDLTQAVNEVNTLSDGTAKYILYLPDTCADTNIADNNPYGPLTMPGNGKSASVTLTGGAKAEDKTDLTFSGNISMNGNLTLKGLVLNPVKGNANNTTADFNISVTGSAKNGGAALILDDVQTRADISYRDDRETMAETGYVNQISGTRNVTNVTIQNSSLRLKTGISNVNAFALEDAHMITCKASTLNDLYMNNASWDALGASAITNITHFEGADSYLAGKQDSKKHLSQLTVSGKVETSLSNPVNIRVIAASDVLTEIQYLDSVKDVALLKAPREAAGKFTAFWDGSRTNAGDEWVEPEDRVYYKDTADYVFCGDIHDMAVKLTGADKDQTPFAETYARSWQDAVTTINNMNELKASYTLELLKEEIFTGKNGTFGGMTFPANNKAASLTVRGSGGENYPAVTFSGNLTSYGNITLDHIRLVAVKSQDKAVPVPFDISVNGTKGESSLTLSDVQIDSNGGPLRNINGNNKASVIFDSDGFAVSGDIINTPQLKIQKDATVSGAVKPVVLRLQGGVTFTAKGAVTVTDIEDLNGQNTLVFGISGKAASNLTVNGKIKNTGDDLLCLAVEIPEETDRAAYELIPESLKGTGSKVTLNNTKKLAVMPKVFTSDFHFSVRDGDGESTGILVKANKGFYLADAAIAAGAVELQVSDAGSIRCLDLNQAVSEINNLADGTAEYRIELSGNYTDTNLTDNNIYSPLPMPGSGKSGALTLSGVIGGETQELPVLTFTGNIAANGNLTLEHLELEPVKGGADRRPADCNISAVGNAKSGASLTLDDVRTIADKSWNREGENTEAAGFINQISGTKNITNAVIKNSDLRLKTGVQNISALSLEAAHLITCKTSAVNALAVRDASWDALGVTTIVNITDFTGEESYIAGKQDAKKFLPQLTLNGKVTAKDHVTCKVIKASNYVTSIAYADTYKDVALLKASKEAAGKFRAAGTDPSETGIYYKDTASYAYYGDQGDMAVRLTGTTGDSKPITETYAKSYQDAVTIINNLNEAKSVYVLEFLHTGEVCTGKGGTVYAALTLPGKTAGITIRGLRTEEEDTVLGYTGTLKPTCPVTFEDIVLTEGTWKKNVFTPAWQITLAAGNGNVTFRNTATQKNPNADGEEARADLVLASAAAAKNRVTLQDEKVYVKGNFAVQNLGVSGNVTLVGNKAVTLTNIVKADADAANASLVVDTKVTAITRAGQQSVTQLAINGTIQEVAVGIAPQMYDLSSRSYHRLTSYEARALLAVSAKPNVGQKLANVSKNFVGIDAVSLLYSYDSGWSTVEKEGLGFYLYSNGIYVKR